MTTKKTLYYYDGFAFMTYDEVSEYIERKIGGKYNNRDVTTTAEYLDECEKIEEREVEWTIDTDITNDANLLLKQFEIVICTTKDQKQLNQILKDMQIFVNRVHSKGFYN